MKIIGNPACDKFKITIHFEWIASPEQIFGYEGQGPENPTVEDVVKEIEKCKSISEFIKDWCLEQATDEGSDFVVTITPAP